MLTFFFLVYNSFLCVIIRTATAWGWGAENVSSNWTNVARNSMCQNSGCCVGCHSLVFTFALWTYNLQPLSFGCCPTGVKILSKLNTNCGLLGVFVWILLFLLSLLALWDVVLQWSDVVLQWSVWSLVLVSRHFCFHHHHPKKCIWG